MVTGTPDKDYNVIWFTEACLSNVLRLETHIKDAERAGDTELAEFFRRAQSESRTGAEQERGCSRAGPAADPDADMSAKGFADDRSTRGTAASGAFGPEPGTSGAAAACPGPREPAPPAPGPPVPDPDPGPDPSPLPPNPLPCNPNQPAVSPDPRRRSSSRAVGAVS